MTKLKLVKIIQKFVYAFSLICFTNTRIRMFKKENLRKEEKNKRTGRAGPSQPNSAHGLLLASFFVRTSRAELAFQLDEGARPLPCRPHRSPHCHLLPPLLFNRAGTLTLAYFSFSPTSARSYQSTAVAMLSGASSSLPA